MNDNDMRANPLTLKGLSAAVNSAHAFWKMPLQCEEHTTGTDVIAFSNGTLEIHCHQCKKMLGVLLIDKGGK